MQESVWIEEGYIDDIDSMHTEDQKCMQNVN
jgi:hypothetical protein